MKILVVKLSAFGDIIHSLPALDDLLARPEVDEVHWLVDSRYRFVADVFPKQVIVHEVALKGAHPLRSAWECVRTLRRLDFDAVIDLQGLLKTGVLARMIGNAPYGFDAAQTPEWPNHWFVNPVPFHPDETHVVQVYRRIASAPFGIGSGDQAISYRDPHIELTDSMRKAGEHTLADWQLQPGQYVVLHLGGSYATKRLPDTTWSAVAAAILKRGLTPLLLWGNDTERRTAETIHAENPHAMIAPARLGTAALCGLLTSARVYIGVDTGVSHLAAALGVPNVCAWGPTSPKRMGAINPNTRHILAGAECAPCFQRSCDAFICMPDIRPESLLQAMEDVSANSSGQTG